jgi:DNA-binding NtrC family response regulator
MMKKRILVVDDEKAIRNSFELTFEDSDYKVDTAESGKAGVEKVQKNDYELIFLDLKMPEMNGVEALKQIKKIKSSIPIYIITAFHKDFFNELEQASSNGYEFELLQKPLNSDQLFCLVDNVLQNVKTK